MNDGKVERIGAVNEILDEIVDRYVTEEKGRLEKKGIEARKIEIKTRLAKSVGLGNGSDSDDAALRALYRLCSGESSLSLERAALITRQTGDYRLVESLAWSVGLLTTPRVAVDDLDSLDAEDIFAQIVTLQQESASLVTLLMSAYQGRPSREIVSAIEDAHRKAALSMEKGTALLIRSLVDKMLKTGAAGK